jgi:chromatin remodeling complex protein RSC6
MAENNTVTPVSKVEKKSTHTEEKTFQDEIKESFGGILGNISSLKSQLTALMQQLKSVEKKVHKRMKQLEKENKKSKNKGNRNPSGFAHPTNISEKLCDFMKIPNGTKMARTDVTKYIIQYIKKHDLQNKENAKMINPNQTLKSLLEVKDGETVTYFNIQRLMNKHFLKSA